MCYCHGLDDCIDGAADVREDIVVSRYRLWSAEIVELLALISEDVSPQTNRGHSISAETKLLLTLTKGISIPRVLGAVDGTLVPIITPHDNEEVYVCRKGYHALNIQAVVDSNM
ncbi:hypothetical protein MAR_031180, partial [Mya arenaria]